MKLPQGAPDTVVIQSFAELGSQAILTNDRDSYASHIDRSTSIGMLLLTGFMGRSRFPKLSKYWRRFANFAFGEYWTFSRALKREAGRCRQSRHQEQADPCRPQLFDAAVIQSISNLDASHGMIERC
jgi:hypothetical protein